jgi:hypothetical protein
MSSKLTRFLLLLALALAASGCGDLLGTKVVKRQFDGSQFSVECELDMNKFGEIMNENIGSQIRCLGENLNLFIRIVKSGKPGYISRVQLEEYLAKFRPDVQPEVVKALKAVFDLGHLITGEDPDYISKATVDKVINFALVFNQEAALNYGPIFKNESPVTYALHQNHRDRVSGANKAIIQSLRTIFNPSRGGALHKLNIISLLESFSTEANRDFIERARKVLFLKKVILGGEDYVITHNELEKLILNFDQLLLIGLDAYRYKYIILKQESLLQLLKRNVDDLFQIVTQGALNNRDTELLFTLDQAIAAAKLFVDAETFDVEKFRSLISEVKKIVMKGNATEVKGVELKNLFVHAQALLKTGTIFHRIYDKFKAQLDGPRPVEETIDFNEYRYTYPEHQAELDQFERIAKRYRFMKGEFLSSYYTRGFRRNADAFFEIAFFEYAITLALGTFGSPSPNPDAIGGYSIDQKQMQRAILKFERELVELDLLTPGRAIGTADNISLLGTLFQYQSDTNKVMDVNEATEFVGSLLSSFNIADDIYGYLREQNCPVDRFDRIEPACFKASFWKGLCTHYRSYLPLLFDSMGAPERCEDFAVTAENALFLQRAVTAARTCNNYSDGDKEEIPFAKGDFMTILVALLHAETTIHRWDANRNNILDPDEVERGYVIYSPALDGFLENKNPLVKRFKKQIFQYMIKHETVPDEKDFGSVWKFVKFLLRFNKKAPATRRTILSVLGVIGEENKKLQTGPQFDCNLLRDPDAIPRVFESDKETGGTAPQPAPRVVLAALAETVELVNSFTLAFKQVLRDELYAFAEGMERAPVTRIRDVRQRNLRGLFLRIAHDPKHLAAINDAVREGSELEKVAFVVSLILADVE